MTLVKLNRKPFEGSFNNFVDDLFTELPALFKNDFNKPESRTTIPVNVKETEKSYRLEVVAPGFEKNDFKVNLDQNLLTISAEKKDDPDSNRDKEENQQFIRREFSQRTFKRSFTIDDKIDATMIDASYINGILVLNLPKKEEVKAPVTNIEIK